MRWVSDVGGIALTLRVAVATQRGGFLPLDGHVTFVMRPRLDVMGAGFGMVNRSIPA
jgi:hypothetical protein